MINKKTNNNGFSSFGFSTILLCFVMICVVIFSVLSLVTANSDYKLSQKVAQKTKAYYEAEIQAYEKLAMIDSVLVEYYETSPSKSTYYANLESTLSEYGTFENNTKECYLSFIVPVEKNQYISIKIGDVEVKELEITIKKGGMDEEDYDDLFN